MKKTVLVMTMMCVLAGSLAACGTKTEEATEAVTTEATTTEATATEVTEAPQPEYMEYIAPDGWTVNYDASVLSAEEVDEHTASFVYTGESAGACMLTIKYEAGADPEETLKTVTGGWTEDEVAVTESVLPNNEDVTTYSSQLDSKEGETTLSQALYICAYNGGTLSFEFLIHMSGDDATDMAISDALTNTFDSIKLGEVATATDSTAAEDIVYMGGLYISEPDNDLELALYKSSGTPIALISKGGNIYYGEFEAEDAKTSDGAEYIKITVENKEFGYSFDEGYGEDSTIGGFLIDEDGTKYDAKPLDESVAMELVEETR